MSYITNYILDVFNENTEDIIDFNETKYVSRKVSEINNRYASTYKKNDLASYAWDKAILAVSDQPIKLFMLLKANKAKLRSLESDIYLLINYYTAEDVTDEEKSNQLKKVLSNPLIKSVKITQNNTIVISTKDGKVYKARPLNQTLKSLSDDPIVKTSSRMGKCHEKSIDLMYEMQGGLTLVTGHIHGLTTRSKYTHSWIETEIDGEQMVIDYTMNAVMNKSGYYSLREAEPMEKIYQSDLISDYDSFSSFPESTGISPAEFLIYHDDVMDLVSENTSV